MDFNPGGMGGIETYIRNLVSSLLNGHGDNHYTLICSEANVGNFPSADDIRQS